jgi:hypothetical protein
LRTRLSKEDELITEQKPRNYSIHKGIKAHYQEVIQLRYFQEMSQEISNSINEPLSNVKVNYFVLKNYWQKLLGRLIPLCNLTSLNRHYLADFIILFFTLKKTINKQ